MMREIEQGEERKNEWMEERNKKKKKEWMKKQNYVRIEKNAQKRKEECEERDQLPDRRTKTEPVSIFESSIDRGN